MNQDSVVRDPYAAADALAFVPNVTVTRVLDHRAGVEFALAFAPPWELVEHGYSTELARLLVSRKPGADPLVWPCGPRRLWKHRNPGSGDLDEDRTTGPLCLWYPGDPEPLRWSWSDGLDAFVVRTHKHLFSEEFWRREGSWPAEDAPHGQPPRGVHPIKSPEMNKVVTEWKNSQPG